MLLAPKDVMHFSTLPKGLPVPAYQWRWLTSASAPMSTLAWLKAPLNHVECLVFDSIRSRAFGGPRSRLRTNDNDECRIMGTEIPIASTDSMHYRVSVHGSVRGVVLELKLDGYEAFNWDE